MSLTLNPQQSKAIKAELTETVVVAGAGSGKTRVLIERIVFLIQEKNISPEKIWIITFTNKAIEEIKERIKQKIAIVPTHINTFHGSFIWILRKHIHILNRNNNFKIIDEQDKTRVLKGIIKSLFCEIPAKKLIKLISLGKKSKDIDSEEFKREFFNCQEGGEGKITHLNFKNVFKYYKEYLLKNNYIDFDDIELLTASIVQYPEVAEDWNQRFDAILIDEFQDINDLQFQIISKILKNKRNIFCVGDPDQCIYKFRGSKPEIFNDFLNIYKGSKLIKLEQNYRSTKKILKIANHLINNNKNAFSKNLFTNNVEGQKIKILETNCEIMEADWIIQEIQNLVKNSRAKLSECLILYRNNNLYSALEKKLINAKLPYFIFGNVKFMQREEIKNVLAYLSIAFEDDEISLERIFNVPSRKIGPTTWEKVKKFAALKKIKLFDVLKIIANAESKKVVGAVDKLKKLFQTIEKIRTFSHLPIKAFISKILEITQYQDFLISKKEGWRIANIELFAKMFDDLQKLNSKKTTSEIVSEFALYASNNHNDKSNDCINLSTIHNAKGTEYNYVFVMKMIEGIFPSKANSAGINCEDERRLAYVAFTRAKKQLFLSSSETKIFSDFPKTITTPSQFIKDVSFLPDIEKITRLKPTNYFSFKSNANKKYF